MVLDEEDVVDLLLLFAGEEEAFSPPLDFRLVDGDDDDAAMVAGCRLNKAAYSNYYTKMQQHNYKF